MNALTLAIRLAKLGLLPGIDFIGNGNDIAMTESGARTLDTYTRFYIHTLPDGEQVQQLLSVKRTLEEEITLAEKGAIAMDRVSGEACKMMLNHGRPIHAALEPNEAHSQLLGRVKKLVSEQSFTALTPNAVTPEPVTELIYSTKHREQPTGRLPVREIDLFLGTQRDSVLTSDVRTDGQVMKVRQGVGKARPVHATKAGTVRARATVQNPFDTIMDRPKSLEEYQLGVNSVLDAGSFMNSVPKPDPTGRTSLRGNRFTGESEGRPLRHPLDYLIDELVQVLAYNNKDGILEYYREYLGTRDKPRFLRLRRAQQVRAAKRALTKLLADTRKTRAQSIEKQFGIKPGTFGG